MNISKATNSDDSYSGGFILKKMIFPEENNGSTFVGGAKECSFFARP